MQPIHCVVLKWSLIFTLPIRPNLAELKQTSTKLWVCFLCLMMLSVYFGSAVVTPELTPSSTPPRLIQSGH